MDPKILAKKITELRKANNLTQEEFGEIFHVSNNTVSKWENGKTIPDVGTIRNISEHFNVPVDSLINDSKISKHKKKFLKNLKFLFKIIIHNFIKIIFLSIFIILLIYFINNYKSVNFYYIKNSDDTVNIDNGYMLDTKDSTVLVLDNIKIYNIDYEIVTVRTQLYTIVNGDKYYFYEGNSLDSIFIEEKHGYDDTFNKDILNSLKEGIYISVNILDDKDETHTYKTKFDVVHSYSNDKLFYLKPKKEDPDVFTGYRKNSDNELTELDLINKGFIKNEKLNAYIKVDNDIRYTFYLKNKSFEIYKKDKKYIYKFTYFHMGNYFCIKLYNKDGTLNTYYDFYEINKILKCYQGNCENYEKNIDYINKEYAKLLK